MTGQTFIECERVELRPAEEGDLPFLRKGVNHPDVRHYIGALGTPYTDERYREELWPVEHRADNVSLLAVPKVGDHAEEPVGSVQLHPLKDEDGYANLGVWFHPKAWGRGYALKACAHLVEYGFQQRRLRRISATAANPNDGGRTLCERLGLVHEGTMREAQFVEGRYVDVERYGLLVDEWDGPAEVLDERASGTREGR